MKYSDDLPLRIYPTFSCSIYEIGWQNQFVDSNSIVVTVENPNKLPTMAVHGDRTPTVWATHQKITTLLSTRSPTTAAIASGLAQFGNTVSIIDTV